MCTRREQYFKSDRIPNNWLWPYSPPPTGNPINANNPLWSAEHVIPTQTDRHHSFKSGSFPKAERGQIYLNLVTVLWSPWNSTDIKRGFIGAKVLYRVHALHASTSVLWLAVVLRLSPLLHFLRNVVKKTTFQPTLFCNVLCALWPAISYSNSCLRTRICVVNNKK